MRLFDLTSMCEGDAIALRRRRRAATAAATAAAAVVVVVVAGCRHANANGGHSFGRHMRRETRAFAQFKRVKSASSLCASGLHTRTRTRACLNTEMVLVRERQTSAKCRSRLVSEPHHEARALGGPIDRPAPMAAAFYRSHSSRARSSPTVAVALRRSILAHLSVTIFGRFCNKNIVKAAVAWACVFGEKTLTRIISQ